MLKYCEPLLDLSDPEHHNTMENRNPNDPETRSVKTI